jgi:hypothetical protein
MSHIQIIGDSFAAQHPTDLEFAPWYVRLRDHHRVENYAAPGVGQYKINQQYVPVGDVCILVITSELRLHCSQNPFYPNPMHYHHRSDLIYSDVRARLPDERAKAIDYFFREIFDIDHARYIHNLLLHEIESKIQQYLIPVIFFKPYLGMHDFTGRLLDLHHVFEKYRGDVNHLTPQGHEQVYQAICQRL